MKKETKQLLFISIAIFILRIPGLYQPFLDIDESVFSEFANILINGGLPYVDAIDNKPPLMYYFFYYTYSIFGQANPYVIHLITTLMVIATTFGVYSLTKKIKKNGAIVPAVVFALLMHVYEPKYISTNGETLMNLPLILSILLFFRYNYGKHLLNLIISGLMLGIATLISYKAGLTVLTLILFLIAVRPFYEKKFDIKNIIIQLFTLGIFSMLPLLLFVVFFYKKGIINESLYWGFLYNFKYISRGATNYLKIVGKSSIFIFSSISVWIIISKFYYKFFFKSDKSENNDNNYKKMITFLFIWLLITIYSTLLGGRVYGHYFIQIVLPLSIIAGISYDLIKSKKAIYAFWGIMIFIVSVQTVGRINIDKTYELINYSNWEANVAYKNVGNYIKDNSKSEDKIFAWGWATPIYHYANRRPASRFLIADFISGRVFGTTNISKSVKKINDEYFDTFLKDLKTSKPIYFVDCSSSNYYGYDRFPINNFTKLDKFIKSNYILIKSIDSINIYKKNIIKQ